MSETAIGICIVLAFILGMALAFFAGTGQGHENGYKMGFDAGKKEGFKEGVTAEWNRINDANLEKARQRRLRDGRTREHKRAMKGLTK